MSHTKGPWHFWAGVMGGELSIYSMASAIGSSPICTRVSQADAPLIAAAPEMLVGLKFAKEFHLSQEYTDHHEDVCDLCTRLNRIIARAEGTPE